LGTVVETYGALNGAGASGIVFGELPRLWPRSLTRTPSTRRPSCRYPG
jgi:hypothetical protein